MNQLDALKQCTTVVADTGDFRQLAQFKPQDATTNPSLILKAVQKADYAPAAGRDGDERNAAQPIDEVIDRLLVRFGTEILQIIPGRVSTEVDARLSFDTAGDHRAGRAHRSRCTRPRASPRERVLIKVAVDLGRHPGGARSSSSEGIHCNLTLLFSLLPGGGLRRGRRAADLALRRPHLRLVQEVAPAAHGTRPPMPAPTIPA